MNLTTTTRLFSFNCLPRADCGWHDSHSYTYNGQSLQIKYSLIGNSGRCLSGCYANNVSAALVS